MAKARVARVLEDIRPAEEVKVNTLEAPKDEKGKKTVVDMSMEEVEKMGWKNKSQQIRGLLAMGYSRSAIAKFMNIKYQFVRNVEVQPLKKG